MPKVEKVPGKDEYIFAPRGTNSPEGAAIQRADGLEEMLRREEARHYAELVEAERVIATADDNVDQAILRNYYCLGMTLRMTGREVGMDHSGVWKRMVVALDKLDAIWKRQETAGNELHQTGAV